MFNNNKSEYLSTVALLAAAAEEGKWISRASGASAVARRGSSRCVRGRILVESGRLLEPQTQPRWDPSCC